MKRLTVLVCALCLFALSGCSPARLPLPDNSVLTVPAHPDAAPLTAAVMDAVEYAVLDYVNRPDVVKPVEYLSWDLAGLYTAEERAALEEFMGGFGVPFDQRGTASGRTLAELQKGVELDVTVSPETTYAAQDYPLTVQVNVYKGAKGKGYFAYFQKSGRRYVLTECSVREDYTRR